MRVDDVLEVCLYATNLDETAEFYRTVLGLASFSSVAGRHVFFHCGDRVLLLFQPERTRQSSEVPAHGATGAGHVAFAVAESRIPAWRAHLDRCGVPLEAEVRWPNGGRSLYLRDPAGNSVELAPRRIWPPVPDPG
jgi:catechol 2,3-dioxygenase-like lactoylglutathione lyase family enzyme